MEFLLMYSLPFFIMGALVLLFSGGMTFLFPNLHYLITISIFGLAGLLYTYFFGTMDLAIFAVFYNMFLALLAVGIVKVGFYIKSIADQKSQDVA